MANALSRRPLLPLTVAAVLLSSLAWFAAADSRLMASYLVGFLFFVTVGLGALFFVLVQHLTRAGWSVTIRRRAEHLSAVLVAAPVLFVPIACRLELLYPWIDPAVAGHRAVVLNPAAFQLRAAIYLLLWAVIAWRFRRGSLTQDTNGDPAETRRLQSLSAPALLLFALSLTLAAFDWIMSLSPHWYSTMFGVYFFSGAVVGGFAAIALQATRLRSAEASKKWLTEHHLHQHGKLLFAFVTFWAYVGFSQFLLIWYANLPEETVWFAERLAGPWCGLTVALVLGHFIVPFALLLSQRGKRHDRRLAAVACWLLAVHYFDLFWLVVPAVAPRELFAWGDLAAAVGFSALLVGVLRLAARGGAVIPERDPRLAECLAGED